MNDLRSPSPEEHGLASAILPFLGYAVIEMLDTGNFAWAMPPPDWCERETAEGLVGELALPEGFGDRPEEVQLTQHRVIAFRHQGRRYLLAERRSGSAEEQRRRFFATFSHDLRTPLNAIIGFSKLLEIEKPGALNERQREFVRHVLTAAQQLLEAINRGLDETKSGDRKPAS